MSFAWLKRYVPRGIYGRAALILILPVVCIQLVVSVVFIQRHFEGVTTQMTATISDELTLVAAAEPERRAELAQSLQIAVREVPLSGVPVRNQRRWYDLSGVTVISVLRERVPQIRAVELPDDYVVRVYMIDGDEAVRMTFPRAQVSASNPHQLLVNMMFFGALMTLVAYVYLRNQLRPITRLATAAEAFGKGHAVPYRPAGAAEVRAAGAAFLAMRNRIERQIEQRTLMLSGVSHDLRTPLTRLKLGLSMLEDEEREPLERDVQEMQRMIDEFLDFARGAAAEKVEKCDPVAMVRGIVEDAARGGAVVRLVEATGEGRILLRPGAMRRALENLISNAVRYGSRAEVSVQLSEKALRIRVEDDGPGIPPEQREDATRPFARLEPGRNQNRVSGVGLGLAIATDIARTHGGVLRLGESGRLGGLQADIVLAR
ncbi:sensor histidine kinase [Pseudooceanicola batsensis HTCC2597]|uniref:histidine kinase n=1 Tax=Pseudooceanicola batsensis (strain ATCC BAA-863 / DSM 15984 / KCTC 12145 / HTCC2597) TaxID=252305 RepID=A3TXM7_PSEBH|nr:ATP-binding protein [Pseudooceanicola batsensis]EAQ03587.1 sensor histidine kinase [Pseudooceanicola batsensis HTCC2597]